MPSSLLTLLVPLFGAIFFGAGARALRLFDGEDARRFSRFVFLIAMPFAGFEFMRKSGVDGEIFLGLAAGYLLGLMAASAAAFLIARQLLGLTVREAGAAVFSSTCGNAIFLGIPIATAVDGWASPFLILVLFEGTFVFALGTALMTWPEGADQGSGARAIAKSVRNAFQRALTNPIVIGTILGLVASIIQLELPGPIAGLFGFFARTAGPVGLFVLGVNAANLVMERRLSDIRGALYLLPVKFALFPGLTAALVYLFTQDVTATTVAALFTGLPPAVASIVLSSVYRQWIGGVSAVVTAGTVVGLVLLAGFLAFVLPS